MLTFNFNQLTRRCYDVIRLHFHFRKANKKIVLKKKICIKKWPLNIFNTNICANLEFRFIFNYTIDLIKLLQKCLFS